MGKDNPELNSYTSISSDMQSPPIILTKKKVLKREKSRVQFFIENDPPTANRPNDRQRMEDSPTESWKSEYSGTDLRQSTMTFTMITFYQLIEKCFIFTAEADAELKHTFVTEPHLQTEEENVNRSNPETLRLDSYGTTSESDLECCRSGGLETPDGRLLYRHYIERALKNKGLRKMLRYGCSLSLFKF